MRLPVLFVRRWAFALLLLPLLVPVMGCPESDPLDSTIGPLTLSFNPVNAAATRYEHVLMRFSQIGLRPVDPDADANLGPSALGLLTFPVEIDLAVGGSSFSVTNLKGGEYRVVNFTLQRLSLIDEDPAVPPTTCLGGVIDPGADGIFGTADDTSTIADGRFGILSSVTSLTTFSDDRVSVAPGGGTITVSIDVPALAAAWESGFTCFPSVNNLCGASNVPSINCLGVSGSRIVFNTAVFTAAAEPAFAFD